MMAECSQTCISMRTESSTDEKVLKYLNGIMELDAVDQVLDKDIIFTGQENVLTLSTCAILERQ